MRSREYGLFHEGVVCSVLALNYDFRTRTGTLMLPEHCCVDMSGTIKMFSAIDAEVVRIDTYAGNVPDTSYQKNAQGWIAHVPRRTRSDR